MCHTVPTVGVIVASIIWTRTKDVKIWWLTLLFGGGALFGIIDHWFNGELFLISENIVSDLFLGCLITAAMFIGWKIIIVASKKNSTLARYVNIDKNFVA